MVSVKLASLHYALDHIYGAFMHRTKISPPFFSRGWGGSKLDMLETMIKQLFPPPAAASDADHLSSAPICWPPKLIQPVWNTVWETNISRLRQAVFRTPCDDQLIDALPPESHNVRVAFLTPKSLPPQNMACVLHLAVAGLNYCYG